MNKTATRGTSSATSVIVVGPTTTPGGVTTFQQGPSQTASVQKGGAGKAVGGIGALGLMAVVMLLL